MQSTKRRRRYPTTTLNFIHVSQYTKNFNIRHIHWTVNDVTGKEPLERSRGVFTDSVVPFLLEDPAKAVKTTLSRVFFPCPSCINCSLDPTTNFQCLISQDIWQNSEGSFKKNCFWDLLTFTTSSKIWAEIK